MKRMPPRLAMALAALVLVAACSPDQPAAPPADQLPPSDAESDVLPFAAAKGIAAFHARACSSPSHREFDFWLGQWDITEDEAPAGTNVVEPLLGGCAIRENYVAPDGSAVGTSLNSYDAETGKWNQTWVADYGTDYRMAGGLDAQGVMVLVGERINGANGRLLIDTWTWTRVDANTVIQTGRITVPAVGVDNQFFNGVYHRVPAVNPAPAIPSGLCDATPYTDADFLVGTWVVKGPLGFTLGTSAVTKTISGCLVEEHFMGRLGYEAVAFTYRDPVTRKWYRTSVDNLGERVELAGDLVNGELVLTGTEKIAGREVLVRLSASAPGAGQVVARHEISKDGGSSWSPLPTLRYSLK